MKNKLLYVIMAITIGGCCKHKQDNPCVGTPFQISPFREKFASYYCNNNDEEYLYIFRHKQQVDSLEPNCSFIGPKVFPIEDSDMVYILLGKITHYINDSFSTNLYKDTCIKKLTYDVRFIQTDTNYLTQHGIVPIYCFVENIPANYQVEVKYQYIPK